jgi:hypothetical protein
LISLVDNHFLCHGGKLIMTIKLSHLCQPCRTLA